MLAGSVRLTLVPASSPVSTVPAATSIALALIGASIVTALTALRTAIPLTPARSPRTGSVPGSYRRPNSTESFQPKLGGGRHCCNRQRHAVERHSNSLGPVWIQRLFLLLCFRQSMPLSDRDRSGWRRSVPGGASGLQIRERAACRSLVGSTPTLFRHDTACRPPPAPGHPFRETVVPGGPRPRNKTALIDVLAT
jgi:hypothetical protein